MMIITVLCLDCNRWRCTGRCILRATTASRPYVDPLHRWLIATRSTSHPFGSRPHIVNHPQYLVLILQVFPILLLRGSPIAQMVEGQDFRSRHWIPHRGQVDGRLESELIDVFSQLPRVYAVPNTFIPRRGDQTHASNIAFQLEEQWVRWCMWRQGASGLGPLMEG
jgi:hypothetical protein